MGFSDRFREAAEAARAKLVEHGVISDADAIHGIHAVEPHDHDIEVAKRAMARGAPDPYSLITHDEVVVLTGIPVGGPSLTYADDDLGVRFDAQDGHHRIWSFGVHAGHAADDETQFDPVSWYEWMVALLAEPEHVPDLGDDAVYADGLLYVRGQGLAFYVLVDVPEGSPARQWTVALARRVLERLDSGEAG
ncbi:MAG TPA: hypothetical protein VFI47_27510 [Acidimicrobiales bacterium]|nr:hypothetical protein [Acidimicrobiales bacterium]